MANRWLYVGSDASCVRIISGTIGTSTALALDTGYCNTSVTIPASGNQFAVDFTTLGGVADSVVVGETGWLHFIMYPENSGTSAVNICEVRDIANFPWFGIRWISTTNYGLFYNSGTGAAPVWTQIGANFSIPNDVNYTYDLAITLGAPHSVSLYIDTGAGSLLNQTQTFTQALFTEWNNTVFTANSTNRHIGAIMANVGISTIAGHVSNDYPTGAGATNTFSSGTYADIDETGINDADLMASNAAGQRATFVYSDIPALPNGYTIGDQFLFTRAKNDGANPDQLKPVRRDSGGTDNVGASFAGMGLTFGPFLARYAVSFTECNASQFGFESSDT